MANLLVIIAVAVGLLACNPGSDAALPDPEWEECENEALGYTVAHPAGWHTNEPGEMGPCRLFHPEPFTVPHRAAIPVDIAVLILVEEVTLDETVGEPIGKRVLEEGRTVVAGREGWRFLLYSTGDGFLPEDVWVYRYHVDLDGRTLIAATHSEGEMAFERKREVLDDMMERLRIHP